MVSDSPSTINVSATEFVPSTTSPGSIYSQAVDQASASNAYTAISDHPTHTSVSPGVSQTEASLDAGQTSTNVYQYPDTNTLGNPSSSMSSSSTASQLSHTSVMAVPPSSVNPGITISPQCPNSNVMFYPSANINPSIPPLQHPHTHTTLTQYGMSSFPSPTSLSITSNSQLTSSTTTSPSASHLPTYSSPRVHHSGESYTNNPVTVTTFHPPALQCVPSYRFEPFSAIE